VYEVLVRFFPCWVYIDSNRCDTLGYEWSLAHCCYLVVCLAVLMDHLDDDGYGYNYHDGYYITLIMVLTTLLMY
jgi:hypothetical protein